MAEISKISGLAVASVSKVDSIAKASIANLLGLTFPSGAAFLLDTYTGAAAGYSVRRLATATTTLLRVRRDTGGAAPGDDDEADVAYDSNNELSLDSPITPDTGSSTTLGQFLNVGTVNATTYTNADSLTVTASAYVTEWKDQSGNANDAAQATQASQPAIHDGTVDTDLILENGKAAIDFDGTDQLPAPQFLDSVSANPKKYIVSVMSEGATAGTSIRQLYDFMYKPGGTYDNIVSLTIQGSTNEIIAQDYNSADSPADVSSSAVMTQSQNLVGHSYDVTASARIHNAYLNGVLMTGTATGYASGSYNTISSSYSFVRDFIGTAQEIICWNSDESTNRTGIETNINTFFSVYP